MLGALLGYWIGHALYETIGKPIIALLPPARTAMQGFIDDFNTIRPLDHPDQRPDPHSL